MNARRYEPEPFCWPAWVCWILEQAHPRYWYALVAAAILLAIVR